MPVCVAKAAVYYFDQANTTWQQVDGSISMVYLYRHTANGSYRVVGMAQTTPPKVSCLRSPLLFAAQSLVLAP